MTPAILGDDFIPVSLTASRICELASSFPPPRESDLCPLVPVFRLMSESEWLRHLSGHTLSVQTLKRSEAILNALSALASDERDPWAGRVKQILDLYEEWAAPHICATRTASDAEEALRRVKLAHRLASFGDVELLNAAKQVRDSYDGAGKLNWKGRLTLARIVATHEPTISNFAQWIRQIIDARAYDWAHIAGARALDFHGLDAARWAVQQHCYTDLIAAATLCGQLARAAARTHDPMFDFERWNRHERKFSEMALAVAQNDAERTQALEGVATTGVQLMMRVDRRESWDDLLTEASQIESAILEYGRSQSGRSRHAHRLMAQLAMTCARRARRRGVAPEHVERLVKKALEDLENWFAAGNLDDRPETTRRRVGFLLEFRLFEEAMNLYGSSAVRLHRARGLLKDGAAREAVKELVRALERDDVSEAREIVAVCCALHDLVIKAQERGVVIAPGLTARIVAVIRKRVGLLIDVAGHHLADDNLAAADACIEAALYGEPDARNLLHMKARVLTREGNYYAAVKLLERAFASNPSLRRDDRLTAMFLTALRRTGQAHGYTPDDLWQLARSVAEPDVYARYDILRWQVIVGLMTGWVENVTEAAAKYRDDRFIQTLPRYLWRRHKARSIGTFRQWLASGTAFRDDAQILNVLDMLPGDAFYAKGLTIPAGLLTASQDVRRAVVRGLVRGLVRASDTDRLSRAQRAAAWIGSAASKGNGCVELWREWFGSERSLMERVAAGEARRRLLRLRSDLFRVNRSTREWHDVLAEFLRLNSPPSAERDVSADGALLAYCATAQADYRPFQPDAAHWFILSQFVEQWLDSTPADGLPAAAASLWLELHDRVRSVIRHRIISVCYWPIHSFKNRLGNAGSGALADRHISELESVLRQATSSIRWQRIPRLKIQDIRFVVERAAYMAAFDGASRSTCRPLHAVWFRGGGKPLKVPIDERLFGEALRCVLHNSSRSLIASDAGTAWIQVDVKESSNGVLIEVLDNGVGCQPDQLAALNEPFCEPVSTWGSGFGTRLCHRIMRMHGGAVRFTSSGPSQGLKAILQLPFQESGHDG